MTVGVGQQVLLVIRKGMRTDKPMYATQETKSR